MDSSRSANEAAINMPESKSTKGETIVATTKAIAPSPQGKRMRGLAILDLIVRICALAPALAAAANMATADQSLPFFSQSLVFNAGYDDFPTFTFFVIANAIVSGYLVLSMPFSIVAIVRPHALGVKLLLLIFDTVMVAFTTAAAAAAASIVYLAHNGNPSTNWFAICNQFTDFCQQTSGAVVASLIVPVLLIVLVVLSGVALRSR